MDASDEIVALIDMSNLQDIARTAKGIGSTLGKMARWQDADLRSAAWKACGEAIAELKRIQLTIEQAENRCECYRQIREAGDL